MYKPYFDRLTGIVTAVLVVMFVIWATLKICVYLLTYLFRHRAAGNNKQPMGCDAQLTQIEREDVREGEG